MFCQNLLKIERRILPPKRLCRLFHFIPYDNSSLNSIAFILNSVVHAKIPRHILEYIHTHIQNSLLLLIIITLKCF